MTAKGKLSRMQFTIFQIITVVTAGLMVGNELAVSAFVHPQFRRLDDKCHVAASKSLALIYGRIMPFWYALTLALTIGVAFTLRQNQPSFFFAVVAAILWFSLILFSIVRLVPINNQIGQLRLESLPDDWKNLRRRWDRLHAIRVGFLVIALICLTVACQLPAHC
ncbi:DUF1772 domain-containing protein [Sphaerothrix gracilis]|uniref:DUF1772 domain-containing protein n=2 Tax=Sphaerothrix gracilis TaxID=3151835 RepID=UPI0031FD89A9